MVQRSNDSNGSPRLPGDYHWLTKEDLDSLVHDARENRTGAMNELLRRIGPFITRYCRGRLSGRYLSYLSPDDVAQEVLIAVLKAVPGYQARGGSFLYLVLAIAANKIADAYRAVDRARSEPVADLPERALFENEPEQNALRADLRARLGEIIGTLPRLQQEILTLRMVVGLSATEIAEALGISAVSARVTQHRAMTRLRGIIAKTSDF